jgi:S1-C subfamily serine protease
VLGQADNVAGDEAMTSEGARTGSAERAGGGARNWFRTLFAVVGAERGDEIAESRDPGSAASRAELESARSASGASSTRAASGPLPLGEAMDATVEPGQPPAGIGVGVEADLLIEPKGMAPGTERSSLRSGDVQAESETPDVDAEAGGPKLRLWAALSGLFKGSDGDTQAAEPTGGVDSSAPRLEEALVAAEPSGGESVDLGSVRAAHRVLRLSGSESTAATDSRVLSGEGKKISRLLDGAGASSADAVASTSDGDADLVMAGTFTAPGAAGAMTGVVAEPVDAALPSNAGAASIAAASPAPVVAPATEALDPAPESVAVAIDPSASNDVSSSVVLVVTPGLSGSGVIVHPGGLVLTNWHVVKDQVHASVFLKSDSGNGPDLHRSYRATVLKVSRLSDLALLKIENPPMDLRPVAIAATGEVVRGERVHAIGHPQGVAWTHSVVTVSKVRDAATWNSGHAIAHRGSVLQGQVLSDPGTSGAPLLDESLHLVGICSALNRAQGLVNAVDLNAILRFLDAGSGSHMAATGS